jgi:hypothetical protein
MVVVSTVLAVARIASRCCAASARWSSEARSTSARRASVTSTTVAPAPMSVPVDERTG